MLKLKSDKKVPSDKYFICENRPLHKVVSVDDTLFHILVVPVAFGNYILHQAHGALGHNVLIEPIMSDTIIFLERIMQRCEGSCETMY